MKIQKDKSIGHLGTIDEEMQDGEEGQPAKPKSNKGEIPAQGLW